MSPVMSLFTPIYVAAAQQWSQWALTSFINISGMEQ